MKPAQKKRTSPLSPPAATPRAERAGGGAEAEGTTRFTRAQARGSTPYYPSPGMEIDLRGQRVEEGLEALDRYIESAYLAGLPFVRIIHGKGTGRLRSYIREALNDAAHVRSWENAMDNEGGEGVTIARLAVG